MRRLASLLLVVLALGGPARAEDPPAPKAYDVATEPAPFEGQKPGEPRLAQAAVPLDLMDTLPDAIQKPSDLGQTRFATIGGKTLVAFGLDGESLRALVDADGDRAFGEGESYVGTPEPWLQAPTGRRVGTRWKVSGVRVGAAELALQVSRRAAGLSGSIALEGGVANAPPLPLELLPDVPTSVRTPAALGEGAVHGVVVLQNRVVAISVAAEADDKAVVAIDLDADNDLSEPGERMDVKGAPVTSRVGTLARRTGTKWEIQKLPLPGRVGTLRLERTDEVVTAAANVTGGRRGRVSVDGTPHVLLLLDADLDGTYAGEADLWWFGPVERAAGARGFSYATMFEGDEPVRLPDAAWRLASVSPEGVARVERVESPEPVGAYLERRAARLNRVRWFPLFEAEAAEFARARGIDPAAPKAAAPARWRFVLTPADALAAAAEEKKPLLVDFEADWCVWCKRFDYYTYPDAAVAERLAKFTLVKLNVDLAWSDEWKGIPAGLPTLAVLDAKGNPVSFPHPESGKVVDRLSGWESPADFARTLDAMHAAATAPAPAPAPAAKEGS